MRPAGGAFGSGNVARNRLAAFDGSGALVTSWNPNANGTVNAVTVDPGSGTVFVGGTFTSIGGKTHTRLAAIDPVTGVRRPPGTRRRTGRSMTSWSRTDASTWSGRFTSIAGSSRTRLAAFDLPGLTLNGAWHPTADNTVSSVAATDGTSTILVGGHFTSVSGNASQPYLAALNATTGAVKPIANHPPFYIDGITPTATQVFVAEGGPAARSKPSPGPRGPCSGPRSSTATCRRSSSATASSTRAGTRSPTASAGRERAPRSSATSR